MTARPTYTIDEIKDMLLARLPDLAYNYAPPAQGSYEDKGHYFTLNPGRADKSVGSFWIHVSGDKAGKWQDKATGQFGDIFDLIKMSLNCSMSDALREARAVLGLGSTDPAVIRRREEAAERAKQQRAAAAAAERKKKADRAKTAHAIWLSGRAIKDTPAEFYLRDSRKIDLRRLGHQPGALRFVEQCYYSHMDNLTGEVIEGKFPAMVAIVNDHQGRAVACHRTYLGLDAAGRWTKADLPEQKKVLGDYAGAWINLWKGVNPEGRHGVTLGQCKPQTRVYVSEGIEDALSGAILLPAARFIAGISLSNLGGLRLPANVSEVVLIADQDEGVEQKAALQRAVQQHQKAGRVVRIWQNGTGGKDLNDALRDK